MSFQDMGKKKSRGTTTTTAQGGFSARPAAPSSAGGNGLSQISENLNQYQVSTNAVILKKTDWQDTRSCFAGLGWTFQLVIKSSLDLYFSN